MKRADASDSELFFLPFCSTMIPLFLQLLSMRISLSTSEVCAFNQTTKFGNHDNCTLLIHAEGADLYQK